MALCHSLKEGNIKDKLKELTTIRGALTMSRCYECLTCVESVLPIDTVLSTGIVPVLVEGVKCVSAKVQLECVWILSNLATGNEDQVSVKERSDP